MITILIVVALALIAGLLYRLGGYGKPYNTKVRDFGVPTCMVLAMAVMGHLHWSLILCFGAMFGAMTTYWDWINKWLTVEDKGREYWFNWALTGFFYGISMLPYVIWSGRWSVFLPFILSTTILTALVSEFSDDVNVEEVARGAIAIGSLMWFM
jgi:hypothetical protein